VVGHTGHPFHFMKLIIYSRGKPITHGYKQREFRWMPKHNCYVFREKEFSPEEFNEQVEKIVMDNLDLRPMVRVVGDVFESAPSITTITTAREITIAEAEDVMERLAPHRLKKKPGPKSVAA
jgi:hypothetical protein